MTSPDNRPPFIGHVFYSDLGYYVVNITCGDRTVESAPSRYGLWFSQRKANSRVRRWNRLRRKGIVDV
jgi:hypothetical protein